MSDDNEQDQYDAGMKFLGDIASALIERDILAENMERPALVLADVIQTILDYEDDPDEMGFDILSRIVDNLMYGEVYRLPNQEEIEEQVGSFKDWLSSAVADFGSPNESSEEDN